jgi:multidrug transporter EmrE-like cation transporter
MEQMRSLILLSTVLGLTVYGQLVIKARALLHSAAGADGLSYIFAMASDLGVLSGLAAAGLAAFAWIAVVQQLEVGFAYPFMALSFVLVPLGARVIFSEPLPRLQIFGMALIVIGVTIGALAR